MTNSIVCALLTSCVLLAVGSSVAALPSPLPPLIPIKANFGPGCNLALRIPLGAQFPISYSPKSGNGGSTVMLESLPTQRFSEGRLYLGMVCYDVRVANVMADAPVRYDENQRQWVRYLGKELRRWDMGDGLDPATVLALDQSIRVYPLNNVNSQGFAYTADDWTGDEAKRSRRLSYCLFRANIAICTAGRVVAVLADGPKGDLTPYVLQILRSIEFLPDEPPANTSASSAPSSGPRH